jgi:hypothetical protein
MSELGPKARAIVEAGRELDTPSVHDRARIQARLTAALGAAAFAGAASQVAASASVEAAAGSVASQAASGLGAASGVEAAALGGATAAIAGHALTAAGAATGAAAASGGVSFALGGKAIALLTAAALSAAAGAAMLITKPELAANARRQEPAPSARAVQREGERSPASSPPRGDSLSTGVRVDRPVASRQEVQGNAEGLARGASSEVANERGASSAGRTAPSARSGDRAAPSDRGRSVTVPVAPAARPTVVTRAPGPRGPSPAGTPMAAAPAADPASGLVARAPAVAATDSLAVRPQAPSAPEQATVASAEPPSAAAASGNETTAAPALSPELRLLAQAQRALRDGKLAQALDLLDEHADRFPEGALQEERHSARAVTLCRLGKHGAARAERARLEAMNARSPMLPWVRASCER